MADLRETKVNISLSEYTKLVCAVNDLEKIKLLVSSIEENYIGTSETALLKALCGVYGKEKA